MLPWNIEVDDKRLLGTTAASSPPAPLPLTLIPLGTAPLSEWQGHLLSCPGQLKIAHCLCIGQVMFYFQIVLTLSFFVSVLSIFFSVTRRSRSDSVSEWVSESVTDSKNRVDWCDPGEWRYLLNSLLIRLWRFMILMEMMLVRGGDGGDGHGGWQGGCHGIEDS